MQLFERDLLGGEVAVDLLPLDAGFEVVEIAVDAVFNRVFVGERVLISDARGAVLLAVAAQVAAVLVVVLLPLLERLIVSLLRTVKLIDDVLRDRGAVILVFPLGDLVFLFRVLVFIVRAVEFFLKVCLLYTYRCV